MKSTLSLTHHCNLNCSYCYAGKKFRKSMSLETACKAVDFSFSLHPDSAPIEFGFFGGEPLLEFKLIRNIVAYIRKKQQQYLRPAVLQITTNGTLITDEILTFLQQENIGLCISLDGPQPIHDRERRYKNGKSSFAKIVKNLKSAMDRLDKLQVNAVYTPETISLLPETVEFFLRLGVPLIHLNPDISADWQCVASDQIKQSYKSVAELYIDHFNRAQEIAINQIDSKIIVFLKGGYDTCDRCGMGQTEWGIAPSGNIYPCERFIGDDTGELYMGNVHSGVSHNCQCSIVEHRGNKNPECSLCHLQRYCMNWCGCTNYSMTGKTNLASSFLCLSEKASIDSARHVLSTLKQNQLFLKHFYRYLDKGNLSSTHPVKKENHHERENHISGQN